MLKIGPFRDVNIIMAIVIEGVETLVCDHIQIEKACDQLSYQGFGV